MSRQLAILRPMSRWCEMAEKVARKHHLKDFCIYVYRNNNLFSVVLQWPDEETKKIGSISMGAECFDEAGLTKILEFKQMDLDYELRRALDVHIPVEETKIRAGMRKDFGKNLREELDKWTR